MNLLCVVSVIVMTCEYVVFAGIGDGHAGGIDGMYPETKEQFDQFGEALKAKITFFEVCSFQG